MDAIIGRYRVRMEEQGLVLRHPSGISFDLTVEETLGLSDFINVYRPALQELLQSEEDDTMKDTDPLLQRVVLQKKKEEVE